MLGDEHSLATRSHSPVVVNDYVVHVMHKKFAFWITTSFINRDSDWGTCSSND